MKPLLILPESAALLIGKLEASGYEAQIVGGCVRDALMGRTPHDWDLCTSALPEQTLAVFSGFPLVTNGLKHGTVTVILDHEPYEITTYRQDGSYTDHRRPDGVTFIRTLREDLARRDFTVNAMAYTPTKGVIDCFGGQDDLHQGIIRCVGTAEQRFDEDGLRILRMLRFASVLNFTIDPDTAAAARTKADSMVPVAIERIQVELDKLLTGLGAVGVIKEHADLLRLAVPDFDWVPEPDSTVLDALTISPADRVIRWTLLLSPLGHTQASALLNHLRFDNTLKHAVLSLLRHCSIPLVTELPAMRHLLCDLGEQQLRQLVTVRQCRYGDVPESFLPTLDALLASEHCFSLRELAVNGGDLRHMGIAPGPALGTMLHLLLNAVLDGQLPNQRQALLTLAEQKKSTLSL